MEKNFTEPQITEEELHDTLQDLIADGLVETHTDTDGVVKYRLTPFGRLVGAELIAAFSPTGN